MRTQVLAAAWMGLSGVAVAGTLPPLVFGAPPRQSRAEQHRLYDPLVRYLTQVLGRPVVFHPARAWWIYQTEVQKARYDLVFDGPQFTGWRAARLGYRVVAAAETPAVVDIVVRAGSPYTAIRDLAGRTVCATPPPSLVGLVAEAAVSDPVAQPHLEDVHGAHAAKEGVRRGLCAAGVVRAGGRPMAGLRRLQRDTFPGQAFSVAPCLGSEMTRHIQQALLSAAARRPLEALEDAYRTGGLVAASSARYRPLATLLRGTWGFYTASESPTGGARSPARP